MTVICIHEDDEIQNHVSSSIDALYDDTECLVASDLDAAHEMLDKLRESPAIAIVGLTESLLAQIDRLRAFRERSPLTCVALLHEDAHRQAAVDLVGANVCERIISYPWIDDSFRLHLDAMAAYHSQLNTLRNTITGRIGKHLFVTGVTGFLGGRMVQELLRCSDCRITALSRGSKGIPYDRRLDDLIGAHADRLEYVEGDVVNPDLGLSAEQIERLAESVDEVWHLAAITLFDESLRAETMRVNIDGTDHMLAFAAKLPKLVRFNHISTAYVGGQRSYPAVMPERIYDRAQTFNNPYEESKYEAELHVAASNLPWVIYRPSIVLGDSLSGKSDGQTAYNIAKMVRLAKMIGDQDCVEKGLPLDYHSLRVVANEQALKNLIPVDQVIDMMLRIRAAAPEPRSIFHVCHPHATPISHIVQIIFDLLNTQNYEIVESLDNTSLSVSEQVLDRVATIFRPYMRESDPAFELANTRRALGSLRHPPLTVDFLRHSFDAFYAQYFGADYAQLVAS